MAGTRSGVAARGGRSQASAGGELLRSVVVLPSSGDPGEAERGMLSGRWGEMWSLVSVGLERQTLAPVRGIRTIQ